MTEITPSPHTRKVKRIGIILHHAEELNISALRFLILRMNSLQRSFEYEFLPLPESKTKLLDMLSGSSPVDRQALKAEVHDFYIEYHKFLHQLNIEFILKEPPPKYLVLVTMAKLSDNYYSTRKNGMSILALGEWKRAMAPPSILEFILTLVLRESVAALSPSLRGSIHLGTKGCLCDFTPTLSDVRFKVLTGFICNYCRNSLQADGLDFLPDELVTVLSKEWLGKSSNPESPAGIASNLGFNLFITKGLKPTRQERFLLLLQEEGPKQILTIIASVVGAALLVWLGLNS